MKCKTCGNDHEEIEDMLNAKMVDMATAKFNDKFSESPYEKTSHVDRNEYWHKFLVESYYEIMQDQTISDHDKDVFRKYESKLPVSEWLP